MISALEASMVGFKWALIASEALSINRV